MAGIKTKATARVGASAFTGAGSEGWEDAPSEVDATKLHMDIVGPSGTGRTTLALTAPGPIALINADEKINGIVQPFVKDGKRIRIATFGFTPPNGDKNEIAAAAGVVWDRVGGWMKDSRSWARSCVFDTGTEGWEMQRLARFGELNPKGRVDSNYGPVNAEFRGLHKSFRTDGNTILVTIHQVKDEYKDHIKNGQLQSIRTGREIRAGFKEMQYMADVVVRTGKTLDGVFTATIEKGWWNARSEGVTFEGDWREDPDNPMTVHFANILAVITEQDASKWKE